MSIHLEISKNQEQKTRILNILYSHLSIQWQIDTLFCSSKVIIQIVFNVKNENVDNILNELTDTDLLLGGLYFCSVSIVRNIQHFYPNTYLDIREAFK